MESKKYFILSITLIFAMAFILLVGVRVYGEERNAVEIPLSNQVIKIYEPISVERTGMLKDGGSVFVLIKDSEGASLSLVINRPAMLVSHRGPTAYDSNKKSLIIAQDKNPPVDSHRNHLSINGEEVPVGGKQEKAVIKILEDWKKSKGSSLNPERYVNDVIDTLNNVQPGQRG